MQDLMPMVLSKVNNYGNQHWECFFFVGLKNVEEVVILKETHGSISNLKMDTTDALDDSLEKLGDQSIDLIDFTNLKNLL